MSRSHLTLVLAGVLLAGIFGIDHWLRSRNQYLGPAPAIEDTEPTIKRQPEPEPEPATRPEAKPTTIPASRTVDPLVRVQAALDAARSAAPAERGALLLEAESLATRLRVNVDKRREILGEVLKSVDDVEQGVEACFRLERIVLAERRTPVEAAAMVDAIFTYFERVGVYEKGVTPAHINRLYYPLRGPFADQASRLLGALATPEKFGPKSVRDVFQILKDTAPEFAPVPAAETVDTTIRLRHRNQTDKPVTETFEWSDAQQGPWQIEPSRLEATIEPGQERAIEFRLRYDRRRGDAVPFPVLRSVVKSELAPDAVRSARVPLDNRGFRLTRVARAGRVATPPKIDGKLDDDAWARAKPNTRVYQTDGSTPAPRESTFWVCYDARGLYIAGRLSEDDLEHSVARATQRDGAVWRDDSIEFMFNPRPEQPDYFHFVINTKNVQYDAINLEPAHDFKWTSAVGFEKNAWVFEAFLSWDQFNGGAAPRPGERMWFNFIHSRVDRDAKAELRVYQWSPAFAVNNHKPEYYGTLEFE